MDTATIPVTGRVLIIDGEELVGWSVASSLQAAGEPAQYLPVRSVAEFLLDRIEPGIVLLGLNGDRDGNGDRIDGVRLIPPLCAAGWRVILMTRTSTPTRLGAAMAAGGFTCVPKSAPFASLLAAIRLARTGRSWLPDIQRQQLIALHHDRQRENHARATRLRSLTAREREVLVLLAAGHRARQIADRFVVSQATVRTQIRAVLTKLEVSSQLEAVALLFDTADDPSDNGGPSAYQGPTSARESLNDHGSQVRRADDQGPMRGPTPAA